MVPPETVRRWLILTGVLTLFCAAVFELAPWVDLDASALFHDPQLGFWLQDVAALRFAREGIWLLSDAVILSALVLLVAGLLVGKWRVIRPRVLIFVLAAYVIGPGLIANLLLKAHWGRARPRDVIEFGGTLSFTPALQISDQCARNCSFVSGEASAVVTMGLIYMLLVRPALPDTVRAVASPCMLVLTLSGALMRMLFGAHFLSDIVFAALLMTFCVLGLYLAFGLHRSGSVWSSRP